MTGKFPHFACAFAAAMLMAVSPVRPGFAQEAPACDPSDETCLAGLPVDVEEAAPPAPAVADAPPAPPAAPVEVAPPAPNLVITTWQLQVDKSGNSGIVTGEVRNDGTGTAYGYSVNATFRDQWGNAIAAGQANMSALGSPNGAPVSPGAVAAFKISVSNITGYKDVQVNVGPNPGNLGKNPDDSSRAVVVNDLKLVLDNGRGGNVVAHATGGVTNSTGDLFREPSVVVWFLDGAGKVVDVVQGSAGVNDVELHANVLRPGQPKQFELVSTGSNSVPQIAQIKSVKALAYTKQVPLP